MPKLGAEPIRKAALVEATIYEIGRAGSLVVTVSQIAKRAGMSSGLAHHYFGSKEEMFLAAMRHVLRIYGQDVREALSEASTPQERLHAILRASFGPTNFTKETVAAWLNFWVLAQTVPEARRLHQIYERRLQSNLTACLRPLMASGAPELAEALGAMIDGTFLREALSPTAPDPEAAVALIWARACREIGSGSQPQSAP